MGPRLYDPGVYVVYPLNPYAILYMYEPNQWGQLKPFDKTISPVEITKDMADHENSGQVGMSYRLCIRIEMTSHSRANLHAITPKFAIHIGPVTRSSQSWPEAQ